MAVSVLSISPFRVGVVRWIGEHEPMATVVVKGTFHLDGEGRASIAAVQPDLSDDLTHPEGAAGELAYASDFVPHKSKPELLVRGYACSTIAAQQVDVVIEVGDHRRAVVATLGSSERRAPLVRSVLRGPGVAHPCVGPRADYSTPTEVEALELRAERASRFNAAPPEQLLETLSEDVTLRLWGMSMVVGVRTVRLPGLRPAIFVVRRDVAPMAVPLTCDTLFVDGAGLTCSLVWRGTVPATTLEEAALVSAVSLHLSAPAWEDIEWQVRHAARELAPERRIALLEPEPLAPASPGEATASLDTTASMGPSPIFTAPLPFRASGERSSAPPPGGASDERDIARNDTVEMAVGAGASPRPILRSI